MEKVQRRATKYILNEYTSDYKQRLIAHGMLPLMHYEYLGISLLATCLKEPNTSFLILDYITFSSSNTYSRTLWNWSQRKQSQTYHSISILIEWLGFGTSATIWLRPTLGFNQTRLKQTLWEHFKSTFHHQTTAYFIYYVHATTVNWLDLLHPFKVQRLLLVFSSMPSAPSFSIFQSSQPKLCSIICCAVKLSLLLLWGQRQDERKNLWQQCWKKIRHLVPEPHVSSVT